MLPSPLCVLRLSGLLGCMILFVVVAALESFTLYVLAKFSERYDAPSYGTLIRRALGRKTGAMLSGVTVLYLWGSSVAYLVRLWVVSCSVIQQHMLLVWMWVQVLLGLRGAVVQQGPLGAASRGPDLRPPIAPSFGVHWGARQGRMLSGLTVLYLWGSSIACLVRVLM